jgi:hypothetical protein
MLSISFVVIFTLLNFLIEDCSSFSTTPSTTPPKASGSIKGIDIQPINNGGPKIPLEEYLKTNNKDDKALFIFGTYAAGT